MFLKRPQPLKTNKKATRQQNQKFQKGMLHPDHLPKKEKVKLKATRQQNQKNPERNVIITKAGHPADSSLPN